MPPHAYQIQMRISHAKPLLLQGLPISRVAADTGFFDTSQFTRHFKRQVGVLTPRVVAGPEVEFPEMATGRIATRVARISVAAQARQTGECPPTSPAELRALAMPQALEETAAVFATGSVEVIGYASTTSAYAIGGDAESAMVDRVSRQLGLPVAATGLSAVRALRALDVDRVALVHPPWFEDELNELGLSQFADTDDCSHDSDLVRVVAARNYLARDDASIDVKAARIHEYGGPEVIRYEDVEKPTAGRGEVLVKVAAAGFNPADGGDRSGRYRSVPLPFTLGFDVAGIVDEPIAGLAQGDRVIGRLDGGGASAEYAVAPAEILVRAPDSIPLPDAAAIPVTGLSAWQAVHEHAHLVRGQRVLVNGAGGGVGGFHRPARQAGWSPRHRHGQCSQR
jgi:hypothetical protein